MPGPLLIQPIVVSMFQQVLNKLKVPINIRHVSSMNNDYTDKCIQIRQECQLLGLPNNKWLAGIEIKLDAKNRNILNLYITRHTIDLTEEAVADVISIFIGKIDRVTVYVPYV